MGARDAGARGGRDSSLELLRVVAACLIVLRHFVGENALDVSAQPLSAAKVLMQAVLYGGGKVGVALFFLISAWFLCRPTDLRSSLKRILRLERQVLFYGLVLLAASLVLFRPAVGPSLVLGSLLPLLSGLWWYPTAYAAFLLVLPFLERGIRALGREAHRSLCVVLFAAFSVLSGVTPLLNVGMPAQNALIFVYLFVLASWWRWYGRPLRVGECLALVLGGVAVAVAGVLAFEGLAALLPAYSDRLLAHETDIVQNEWMLPVVMASFGVFGLFLRLDIGSRPAVDLLARSSFATYLVAQHPAVWPWLWGGVFTMEGSWGTPRVWLLAAAAVASVYLACALIDAARRLLFSRLLDPVLDRAERRVYERLPELVKSLLVEPIAKEA